MILSVQTPRGVSSATVRTMLNRAERGHSCPQQSPKALPGSQARMLSSLRELRRIGMSALCRQPSGRTLGLACLALATASAMAQPIPKINSLSAEWLQRGSTNEITLTGENIGDATGFLISGRTGLSATISPMGSPSINVESSSGGISAINAKDDKSVTAKIAIAADAELGAREIRIATPTGVSNPLPLNIGHLPEIAERQPNHSLDQAQMIELPAVITGRIGAAAEIDHFRFKARKSQNVVFEVYAARAGWQLDSSLALLDAKGNELARNEDARGLDSEVVITIPEDGEYIAQLRDFRYQGGGDHRYRLLAGVMPHVTSVFPFGGQRGQNVEVELQGSNLGGASKVTLRIDPASPLGSQEIRANTSMGFSNPFPFDVGLLPEFTERETNSAANRTNDVVVPVVINGRIKGDKDSDAFKFSAQKDQQFIFEVIAQRFGSPLDVLLTLTDANGAILQRNDDAMGADARIEHKFAADGKHVVLVEDLLQRNGDTFGYRLSIRQPQPDFSVRVLPDNPRIHRGGHVPLRCELTRLTGFAETVRIAFSELPAGLHSEPLLLTPSSPGSGLLIISASRDCPLGTFPIKLIATSTMAGKQISRTVEPLSGDKTAKEAFLTVLEEPPFEIELATLSAALEQNQSVTLEVVAQRREAFNGEIKITAEGFSAGREPITRSLEFEPITLKDEQTRARLTLKAKTDSEIGTRPVIIKGDASWNGHNVTQYSPSLPVTITQVPFVLSTTLKRLAVTALPPGSQSAASEATFTVRAERRAGFTNEIGLILEGLPDGITAMIDKIPANTGETQVKLVATEKAPAGKELTLKVLGTGLFNDRNYKHRSGEIKLSVNAPAENEEAVKAAGSN